jgi:hypothetical protein
LKPSSAPTSPGFVRDRSAIAVGTASTDKLSFQVDRLDGLAASAFVGVVFAALAGAALSAPAENPIRFLNRQQVHRSQLCSAPAFSRLRRNIVAGAIIVAVADVINFTAVRCDDDAGSNKQEKQNQSRYLRIFHPIPFREIAVTIS